MQKSKHFYRAAFSPEVITQAVALFNRVANANAVPDRLQVTTDGERWSYESYSEFIDGYRKSNKLRFNLEIDYRDERGNFRIWLLGDTQGTDVSVTAPDRASILEIFSIFDSNYFPPPDDDVGKPVVFIGHGRNPAWRELKDHLQDKHHYKVETYETGARAGHAIRDILEAMSSDSSIAFLLFTAEDEQADGSFRARENVVHETGLFQGSLGFNRAITLIQNGITPFSNLQGIEQIRYDNIKETFGEVVAVIKREFGD